MWRESTRRRVAEWEKRNLRSWPTCVNIGCARPCATRDWKASGIPSVRTECTRCQNARGKGKTLTGVTWHKKSFCENVDGRLGFGCCLNLNADDWRDYDIHHLLDMDHVNGSGVLFDNTPENVITICRMCHGRKGKSQGDFVSKSARK